MPLLEQRPEGILTVRWVREDAIGVAEHELRRSFWLTPEQLVEAWPPTTTAAIDEAALAPILALQPQLLILGTGARQQFLAPRLQAQLYSRGIGIESMDNAAAARTYNLLASEGRKVAAAFLLG